LQPELGKEQQLPWIRGESYTDGQLLIGNTTGNTLAKATITGGTNLTVTNGSGSITLDVDDAFLANDGDVGTGVYDFGGATSLEIPNSATPTVNADGEIAIDTTVTDFSTGIMKYYGGEEMGVVAMPIAQFTTPTDGNVISYNATNDEFELVAAGAADNLGNHTATEIIKSVTFGLQGEEAGHTIIATTASGAWTYNVPTADKHSFTVNSVEEALIDAGGVDIASGNTYAIAGTDVLTNDTLGNGILNSSLTSVGVLASPVLTTPQINDTSADHQYIFAVSELVADRTVTLPLLTGNDTFTFNDFAATLQNKTIDGDNNTLSNLDLGNEVDWAAADDVSDRTAFASGDKVLIFEAGVGIRKVDYDDLPGAGGGANTNLNNLTATAINLSLISDTDITDDLGTEALRWKDVYAATIGTGQTATDTFKIRGYDTDAPGYVDILTVTAATTVTADLHSSVTHNGSTIVVQGGALGTPSSGVATNLTGTAAGLTAGAVSTITGLAPDTATTAAGQPNITSLGTLTTLTVDDITINGNTISSAGASTLAINPTAGQAITFDSTVTLDAGVVAGITSLSTTVIELGHASDTTLARVSAGVVSVEGVNIVTTSSTDTLTNKTINTNDNSVLLDIPTAVSGTTDTIDTNDVGMFKRYTSASAVTITVNSVAAGDVGGTVHLCQDAAGQLTVSSGTCTVRKSSTFNAKTEGENAVISLIFDTTTTAILVGMLEAV
jgi:hypothetical protein